jgi:uncharacterized protein YcfJ
MSSITEQLQTAIVSGAMTAAQAKSVAANLAEALGDRKFGLDVIAQITELVGPNGEKLEKDPLGVSMKLVQQNVDQTSASSNNVARQGAISLEDAAMIGGASALGSGIGAAIGATVLGLVGGGLTFGAAAVPAAAVGAVGGSFIGGAVGGLVGGAERGERLATVTGAAVAADKIALEQNQEILDAFDLQYEKKINELRLQGKINEAVALENQYYRERETLVAGIAQTKQQILDSLSGLQFDVYSAYMSGLEKSINKKYEGTAQEDIAPLALSNIKDSNLTEQGKNVLKLELETGGMDPLQIVKFFETFKGEDLELGMNLVTRFGGKFATASMQILNSFVDKNGKPNKVLQTKYIQQITAKPDREAAEFQAFFNKIASFQNIVDVDVVAKYMLKNPKAQQALENSLEQIEKHNGKFDLTADVKVIGQDALEVLNQDAAYFNSLTSEGQKVLIAAIKTQLAIEGTPEAIAAYKAWIAQGNSGTFDQFAMAEGKRLVAESTDLSKAPVDPEAETSGDGGGGPVSSSLDDLMKKIRDVRKGSSEMTLGWKESMTAMRKLFGGDKSLTLFNGLENQLRKIGAGEDLITLIAGMPAEEYKKYKDDLFVFKNGNIVAMKEDAKTLGDALRSIAIGEFVSGQQKISANYKLQASAAAKLRKAGLDAAQAYEVVQNEAVAAAVASKDITDSQLKKVVAAATAAAKAMKLLAANTQLANEAQARQDKSDLIAALSKNDANLTADEMSTVMSNEAIQAKILLDPTMKPEDLKRIIAEAASAADLEITLKSFSVEGLTELFNGIYDKAMEWFSRQENAINLQFESDTKDLNKTIGEAQDKIEDINYKIDDYEAGLTVIAEKEDEINESYDKTLEALDKVKNANEDILSLQRGQLGVADALTQGDIAAAARAAEELSAQETAIAMENQMAAIEAQREADLAAITVPDENGVLLTRKDLETKIRDLKKQIFDIEEDTLEPATRAVELLERIRDANIEKLTTPDGKSKLEWNLIASEAGLAEVNSAKYIASISGAESIVEKIKLAWEELNGKEYSSVYEIIQNTITKTNGKPDVELPGAQVTATDNVRTTGSAGAGTGGGSSPSAGAAAAADTGISPSSMPGAGSGNMVAQATGGGFGDWWSDTLKSIGSMWDGFVNQPWVKSLAAMVIGTYNIFIQPIVDAIVDAFNKAVEWIKTEWDKFTAWFDTNVVQPIQAAWDQFSTWFDTNIIQPVKNAWDTVASWVDTNVVQPVKDAWDSFSGWVDTNVIQPVKDAFSGFFNWFFEDDTLENKIADVEKFWTDVITNVEAAWEGLVTWFKDLPAKIGEAAGNIWSEIQGFGDWLAEKWNEGLAWLGDLGTKISDAAGDIWEDFLTFGDWLAGQWNDISTWFKNLPYTVGYYANQLWQGIQKLPEWLEEQWGALVTWFTVTLPNAIASWGTAIWNNLQSVGAWLGEQWTSLVTWFTVTLPTALAQWGATVWNNLQAVGAWLSEQWNTLVTWFTVTLPTALAEWGSTIWSNLQAVGAWLGEQWNTLVTWFTVTLPTAIAEWGAAFWSGIQTVGAWLAEQWLALSTWFTVTLPAAIAAWGAKFWSSIQAVGAWLSEQFTKLSTWFTVTLPNAIKQWAANFWNGIQDLGTWLGTKLTELKNWFTSLPALVAQWVKGIWDGFWANFKVPQWIQDIIDGFKKGWFDSATGKGYNPDGKRYGGPIRRTFGGGVPGIGNGDVVPAMLTPGEFVMRKEAVDAYGLGMLSSINAGQFSLPKLSEPELAMAGITNISSPTVQVSENTNVQSSNSVYNNYELNVNVRSDSNPDEIARTVMAQIRQINSQQMRGTRF